MIKLVDEMKGDVVVLAVSSDDDQKEITPFLKAFALPKPNFDVVWDADKKVLDLFGVTKVPESFVVGKDGKLIRKVLGIENWASGGAIDYFRMLNR
jgi:peroxiredoxin